MSEIERQRRYECLKQVCARARVASMQPYLYVCRWVCRSVRVYVLLATALGFPLLTYVHLRSRARSSKNSKRVRLRLTATPFYARERMTHFMTRPLSPLFALFLSR